MSQMALFINVYSRDVNEMELFVLQNCLVILGVVLNLAMAIMIVFIRRLKSINGIAYVLNLSCANFLFCILIIVAAFISKNGVIMPNEICKMITSMTSFTCVVASFTRCALALDRYVYIADPLHYYSRAAESSKPCIVVCIWIAAAFVTLPYYVVDLAVIGEILPDNSYNCLPMPALWYVVCVILLGILVPMICEIFVYTRIFYWAFLHIQIMKQEANYCNQLRQRSVKDSYHVDVQQLELFTRASILMASTLFALHPTEADEMKSQSDAEIKSNSLLVSFPRKPTAVSNVASYISTILGFGGRRTTDQRESQDQPRESIGTEIDHFEAPMFDQQQDQSTNVSDDTASLNAEDLFVEEELRRLSKRVEAKGVKVGSKALYESINKLLTCTELKAGVVLAVILGTAVGFWIPFLVVTTSYYLDIDPENRLSQQRKIANVFIYLMSCLDPLVYDLLHQPIRNACRDEARQCLTHIK